MKGERNEREKTEFITMKVTPSFKARAKALAAEEGRSLSNYIEWLINNDMKQKVPAFQR